MQEWYDELHSLFLDLTATMGGQGKAFLRPETTDSSANFFNLISTMHLTLVNEVRSRYETDRPSCDKLLPIAKNLEQFAKAIGEKNAAELSGISEYLTCGLNQFYDIVNPKVIKLERVGGRIKPEHYLGFPGYYCLLEVPCPTDFVFMNDNAYTPFIAMMLASVAPGSRSEEKWALEQCTRLSFASDYICDKEDRVIVRHFNFKNEALEYHLLH